ncbi:MAG: TetR family transcriptional regulator [Clostridia bacterium]|nr:TetR family transcriptional regulator [Clostridia bacterium]
MNQKQSKSDITRAKILSAAEKEFSDKGFFGARIDEIAHSAGVNKRMIYAHFESKEGLYQEILLSTYKRVAECESSFYIENLEPTESIKNVVYTYFRFLNETPSFVRLLMWENLNGAKSLFGDEVRKLKAPTLDYITREIRRGKDMGIFREDVDEYQVSLSIQSFSFSYFSNIHTLSEVFGRDMAAPGEVLARAEFVSDVILRHLMK